MVRRKYVLWLIVLLSIFSVFIDLPKTFQIKFSLGKIKVDQKISGTNLDVNLGPIHFKRPLEIKKGLDLQGGTHLVFTADMKGIGEQDKTSALESAQQNIEKRVNFFGVSEAIVQTSKTANDYRLIVELPGVKDINQAIDLIGKTAQLEFWQQNPDEKEASKSGNFFQKPT